MTPGLDPAPRACRGRVRRPAHPREDDVTDPAATPHATSHTTAHATAQDGLAVASALLRATDERVTAVHVTFERIAALTR